MFPILEFYIFFINRIECVIATVVALLNKIPQIDEKRVRQKENITVVKAIVGNVSCGILLMNERYNL